MLVSPAIRLFAGFAGRRMDPATSPPTPRAIRELLYDYPLAKIPTAEWLPNVAFFQLLLFAFNLVHYFKRLCLPPRYRTKTLKTVRRELLVIPGRLVKSKNRYGLKLPNGYHFESAFRHALAKISKLQSVEIP